MADLPRRALEVQVVSQEGNLVRMQAAGRLVHGTLAESPDPIGTLLGKDTFSRTVLLSLAQVTFIDSSGIGWLLGCRRRFREGGGKFVIHSVPPVVLDIMRVMKLEHVLRLAEDEDAALAMVQGGSG